MSIVLNPAADDYTPLLSRVATWLHRSDLGALVPTFIALAEGEIFRELRLRATELTLAGTTSGTTIAIPAGSRALERVVITSNSVQYTLDYASPNGIERLTYSTGLPARYTVEGELIRLLPAPAAAYAYELHYLPNLDPLSSTNTSTWLSANAPDLYLYASMLQVALYTVDDQMAARYGPLFMKALDSVRRLDESRRLPISGGLQTKPRHAR